jgi:hypothetical protein
MAALPAVFRVWADPVQNFVAHQNIEHFRRLLADVADPQERRAIAQLLQAEIEKLPQEQRDAERRTFGELIRSLTGPRP